MPLGNKDLANKDRMGHRRVGISLSPSLPRLAPHLDPALAHNHDLGRISDGREAVRDDNHGATHLEGDGA